MAHNILDVNDKSHAWIRTASVGIITIIMSLIYLRISQVNGRLAEDITYDDIGYATDAAARIKILAESGVYGFVKSFYENPPHSPYSSLLASFAFLIGGLDDISLYASNAFLLLIISFFIANELKSANNSALILGLIIFLCSPLAFRVIHDFRPDIALGFGTAAMVWLFFSGQVKGDKRQTSVSGYIFAVCLLIKPSFFAHTIFVASFIIGLAEGFRLLVGLESTLKQTLVNFALPTCFIALPYFLINGYNIFQYFWVNTRGGESSIWSYPSDTPIFSLLLDYLFKKDFTFALLGYNLYFSLAIVVFSIGWLSSRKDTANILKISGVLITAIVSLVIVVIGRHQNPFFLASFQWMLLLSSIFVTAIIGPQIISKSANITFYLLIIIGLAITVYANCGLNHWTKSPDSMRYASWNKKILNIISEHQQSIGMSVVNPKVFLSFAGSVNAEAIRWLAFKEGYQIDVYDRHRSDNFEIAKTAAENSAYIVLPNPSNSNYFAWLPSAKIQPALLEWALSNKKLKPINDLTSYSRYFVFANLSVLERTSNATEIGVISLIEGFMSEEGPYPQWSLPRVRWMTNKEAKICLLGISPQKMQVTFRFRSDSEGSLDVSYGGSPMATINLTPGKFQSLSFDVTRYGEKSCIDLAANVKSTPDTTRLLLFSKLQVQDR